MFEMYTGPGKQHLLELIIILDTTNWAMSLKWCPWIYSVVTGAEKAQGTIVKEPVWYSGEGIRLETGRFWVLVTPWVQSQLGDPGPVTPSEP